MKFTKFIKDRLSSILIFIISYFIILLMLFAFKVTSSLIIAITIIDLCLGITLLLIDFYSKKSFYDSLLSNTDRLDKKYLVLETMKKPDFYEGKMIVHTLYEINKSMIENVKKYKNSMNDFKEYVEMWIHEVKIPIATLMLMGHNHKSKISKEYMEQVKKLDCYIDQILYYVRSENVEKDFIITESSLIDIIRSVTIKNKDDLLENKIDLIVEDINVKVLTDSKWLEFILNQILNNSIKYKRNHINSYIKIYGKNQKDKFTLNIYDNGIGIPDRDLSQVFCKSFTGENGRTRTKSTGMGLYIAKKLCDKLGHTIEIESIVNEYTNIKISFHKNDFYKIEK